MICVREALLYSEGDDAAIFAEAANAAALLASDAAEHWARSSCSRCSACQLGEAGSRVRRAR